MKRVTRQEILDYVTYEARRKQIREKIMKIKELRRINVGGVLSFLFENTDTVLYQIQEIGQIKKLLEGGQIEEDLYKNLRSTGAKPARIYGLAKIHKENIPLRPIVSMPGTAYYNLGKLISNWLEKVPESRINTSSEDVSRDIKKE